MISLSNTINELKRMKGILIEECIEVLFANVYMKFAHVLIELDTPMGEGLCCFFPLIEPNMRII